MTENLLNTKQVAERLHFHPEYVRILIRQNKIKALKLGTKGASTYKHWRIRESDLEAFINNSNTWTE